MFKPTMRNTTSGVKEARFYCLNNQFKNCSGNSLLYVSNSYERFCNYLANYTEIEDLSVLNDEMLLDYVYHHIKRKRRKPQLLIEVKKDVQVITKSIYSITGTKLEVDFSVSNTDFWAGI